MAKRLWIRRSDCKTSFLLLLAAMACLCGSACGAPVVHPSIVPPVIDDRARFRQIFCSLNADHGSKFPVQWQCDRALQQLGGEGDAPAKPVPGPPPAGSTPLHIIIIPGIFGQCVKSWALPFQDGAAFLRTQGYRIDTIDVDGRSSSARNAAIIAGALPRLLKPGERLMILGYSKGTSDILETLALYPDAIPPGSAVVSVSGVVSGTPVADNAAALYRTFAWIPLPNCGPDDRGGVESLTRRHRLAWLARHPLPRDRTYFSLASFTDKTHISWPLMLSYKSLSKLDPHNDGQLIYSDAILPGSHLLGYLNADHWAVALPLARNVPVLRPVFGGRNDFPREILLEAIVRSVEEQLRCSSTRSPGLSNRPDALDRSNGPKRM